MKELEGKLTTQLVPSTMKAGRNFMAEPKSERPKLQESGQEPSETALKLRDRISKAGRVITPEKIESARREWEKENERAREAGKPLSTDLATQRIYIESGVPPHRTPEYVRPLYEELAKREGRALTDAEMENIALGIPPISGGAVGFPPGPPSPAAIDSIIEKVTSQLTIPRVTELVGTDPKTRDEYFRSIFEVIDSSPHEFFQQAFTWQHQQRLADFMSIILNASREPLINPVLKAQLEADYERYQLERRIREGTHNVNAILYVPSVKADQLFEHLQSVESLIGDAAHRVLGVVQMSDILERVLREEMRKNDGYLRPEAITGRVETEHVPRIDPATGVQVLDPVTGAPVFDDVVVKVREGDVERRVKEIFNEEVARNGGVYVRDENGQTVKISKTYQPWEVDRVLTTARAVMIMSERLISIAAEGKLGAGSAHYSSLFFQDILQGYSQIIHGLGKFGFTEENAAIFLQDPDEKVKKVLWLLSRWNPKQYEEAYKEFTKNPKAILESDNEFFSMQKQNPFRVGDMATLQSWRYIENPDEPSAVQDFIMRGRERMKPRWNVYHAGDPTFDVYEEFIHRTEYVVPRNAKIKQKADMLKARRDAWATAHPGAPTIEEYIKYVNEYFKWIGTAVRFDTVRTTLDKLAKPKKGSGDVLRLWNKQVARGEGKGEDKEKTKDAAKTADKILERMVRLQPHRLYDKSPDIRKRINAGLIPILFPGIPGLDEAHLSDAQKAVIDQIINNLYLVEDALFQDRESLLNQNKTFDSDTLTLTDFLNRITDDTERGNVQTFLDLFLQDFTNSKDKYLVEFVYRRDFKHGFVLWTGDVPLDEYRLTALGPTGSFARRARDNKTTGEAATELFKLMGKLPEMQSLEQVIPFLRVIYDKIAIYSPDRAKEVIAEISLGIAKFVAERPTTNIPGWGFFERRFGKPSFAKIVYGETGLASGATEVRNFFNLLYNKEHLITKEKYKEITKDKVPASKLDMAVNVASTMSQLIALAVLLYFLSELFKKKS